MLFSPKSLKQQGRKRNKTTAFAATSILMDEFGLVNTNSTSHHILIRF